MNYSSFHKDFASELNRRYNIKEQDVLEHPEKYLGPNYKEVLNFKFYWDNLSDELWYVYRDRRVKLNEQTRNGAEELAIKLASEVIDPRFVDSLYFEELELVASHLYIERNIPLTFLPLFFDL